MSAGSGPPLIRVDLHLHSKYSHDSITSLERLVSRAREAGLDRIALTDHNTAQGALELARMAPDLAIVGEEVKTAEGEVIGLFITKSIAAHRAPEEVMDEIHAMGGLTYLAHPLDRRRANFRPERIVQLRDRIDVIEVFNTWADPGAQAAAAALAAELGKPTAGGSDAHAPPELGYSWMEMEPYQGPADFLRKLAAGRHVLAADISGRRRA